MAEIECVDDKLVSEYAANLPELAHLRGNDQAVILDVACGTGLSAQKLKENGFKCTFGIDASQGMLDQIPRNLFKKTWQVLVGEERLPTEVLKKCDMVTVIAGLGKGHCPP